MQAGRREPLIAPRILLVEVAAGISRRSRDAAAGLQYMERLRTNPALILVSLTDELVEHTAKIGAGKRSGS